MNAGSRRRGVASILAVAAIAAGVGLVGALAGEGRDARITPSPSSNSAGHPPVPVPTPPGTPVPFTARAPRPNIVLVLTDDQRWDTLWSMPNVQRDLVSHGVTFENAFVVNSLCCPSRASVLTGDYSHTTGVYTNSSPYGGYLQFDDTSTVATWLQGAGYDTGLFGKYLNQFSGQTTPPGWNEFDAFRYNRQGSYYYNYELYHDGEIEPHGSAKSDYSTKVITNAATSFIDRAANPFFAYIAPYAPHAPAAPLARDAGGFSDLPPYRPPSFNERDVSDKPAWVRDLPSMGPAARAFVDRLRANQYRSLVDVDRMVGAVVRAVRRTGELHSTLFVFASDNAVAWGEHRWARKESAYEESTHVPFVVRYDPLISSARTDSHLVLNVDIAPTFAAMAGLRVPGVEGRSLVPLVRSGTAPWRESFLIEHLFNPVPDVDPPTYCAVRTETALYVAYETGEEELYDLTADPYELNNIAYEPRAAGLLGEMRARERRLCQPPPPGFWFSPASSPAAPASGA